MLVLLTQRAAERVCQRIVSVVRLVSLAAPLSAVIPLMVSTAALSGPPGASVSSKVQVPSSMRFAPFDTERYLNIPPNFSISVYARITKARFMAIAPNGDLLVSQPSTGKVLLVRSTGTDNPLVVEFVTGLRKPHDLVFHTIGATTYLYVSESHQINRFVYTPGDTIAHNRQVIVTGLPDSSTPELRGAYGHELKNIALDANHKLYVSIASTCNACLADTTSDPIRGAIYQYNADGTNRRFFAKGLRNAEGLAFLPGINNLWVVVNNRDNIAYPYDDGSGNYGKVIPSYVDNHPPEEFTQVRDGGNYGWPFCNPNPDTSNGFNNMPFDRDYGFNADGHVNCTTMDRINKGIQAHSAPLGLTFLQNTNFPGIYRRGVVVGLHGSWNRQNKTGYKVAYFSWDSNTQLPQAQVDLVTGWLNTATQQAWGRPVDMVVDLQGNLLISDDYSSTIYKLTPTEIIVDNSTASDVTLAGKWQTSTKVNGYYDANYIHDQNSDKGSKSVRFKPTVPAAGTYQVYLRWTTGPNRATNVPVDIIHSGETTTKIVNQQQQGGQWVPLGKYTFTAGTGSSVLLRTGGTNGHVIADAVRLVKVP